MHKSINFFCQVQYRHMHFYKCAPVYPNHTSTFKTGLAYLKIDKIIICVSLLMDTLPTTEIIISCKYKNPYQIYYNPDKYAIRKSNQLN